MSHMTVHRPWSAFVLKRRRGVSFKLSMDPLLVGKVLDIARFRMRPPDRAVVTCNDLGRPVEARDRANQVTVCLRSGGRRDGLRPAS